MASAIALGHNGLRLRSRRLRSNSSHRLSWGLTIAALAAAATVGFVGANVSLLQITTTSVVDASTLEQQRFATDLRPIHAEIEQSMVTVGLVVAAYENGEIDATDLQHRLADVLVSYDDAASSLDLLTPPTGAESTVTAYMDEVSSLRSSGEELSKAFDDGDQAQVGAALAETLQAAVRLHDLAPQQDVK